MNALGYIIEGILRKRAFHIQNHCLHDQSSSKEMTRSILKMQKSYIRTELIIKKCEKYWFNSFPFTLLYCFASHNGVRKYKVFYYFSILVFKYDSIWYVMIKTVGLYALTRYQLA